MVGMNSTGLDQIVKEYIEAKYRLILDYCLIEGKMSPDSKGDTGVTGNYRKTPSDKNVFFAVTVNPATRVIQNLQEYT